MFLLSVALRVCKENRTICSELVLWLQKRRVGAQGGGGGGAGMHCTAQYSPHDNEMYSPVHMTDRFRELEPSLETVQLTLKATDITLIIRPHLKFLNALLYF